ncbi:MAG: hypothetical protein JO232_03885 [Verrucomicrobia bacterium]|nr:hypothetical protein [Verrucomicrobiota bacterium]
MVFPDLDVVAVTTGRDNYPSSKLAGYIASSVKSDTALLILGQGKSAERWTLKFDGEKLDVRAELGEGPEITIGGEMDR